MVTKDYLGKNLQHKGSYGFKGYIKKYILYYLKILINNYLLVLIIIQKGYVNYAIVKNIEV